MNVSKPVLPHAELENREKAILDRLIRRISPTDLVYPDVYQYVNELITHAYRQGLRQGKNHADK